MYQPSEDSYILSETLQHFLKNKDRDIAILDLGAGTGIQAETCRNLDFNNITTSDIDKNAVKHLKKQGFKVIKSNLFSDIEGRFQLIIFNPPYLPRHKYDQQRDTTGGKEGYELIVRFLEQARKHLNEKGAILLLFSSLSKPSVIKQKAREIGYKLDLLARKKLFFEELFVAELKRKIKKEKREKQN